MPGASRPVRASAGGRRVAGRLRLTPTGREAPGTDHARDLRVHERHARVHRGRHETPGGVALRSRREGALDSQDEDKLEGLDTVSDEISQAPCKQEPHTQARPDRSSSLRRHRQRFGTRSSIAPGCRPSHSPVNSAMRRSRDFFAAIRAVSRRWVKRLRTQAGGAFPDRVAPFRPEMAVHGRFRRAMYGLRQAGAAHQYLDTKNECKFLTRFQTRSIVLADRALSRLLHKSWPRSIDELS